MKYAYSCKMEAMNAQWSNRNATAHTQWYRDEECWNCDAATESREKQQRKTAAKRLRERFTLQKA